MATKVTKMSNVVSNAVTQQCTKACEAEELKCFVTCNEANLLNCFDPETLAEHVQYDIQVESCFGSIVILMRDGQKFGWWDTFSGLLYVA